MFFDLETQIMFTSFVHPRFYVALLISDAYPFYVARKHTPTHARTNTHTYSNDSKDSELKKLCQNTHDIYNGLTVKTIGFGQEGDKNQLGSCLPTGKAG